jgi:hypothetical protein
MNKQKRWRILCLLGILVVLLSCNLLSNPQERAVESTLASLHLQQTALDQTLQVFTAEANARTSTPDGTLQANLATGTAVAGLAATLSGSPTITTTPSAPPPDERLLESARILLFEDMSASRQIRIVKEALDDLGYFYLDVGSAKGWFKTQLLSDTNWDLVIAAAEAEREFGGEFFQYLDAQIVKGTGVVVENWDIDAAPSGKAGLLLKRCGLSFQADWYMPELRVFYWTLPDAPVFHEPNQIPTQLHNAAPLWTGDLGDLLEVDPQVANSPNAPLILASTNPDMKVSNGVLASCLGGRVILQTFRTHEYQHDDMLHLWQNYIYQTLKAHLAYTHQTLPTPALTAQPTPAGSPTAPGPTPGPGYTIAHGCDGILSVKLTDSPLFQKDLFEHHADGEFLILRLQLVNQSNFPIQIWDQDYFIEARLGGQNLVYSPHKAATGYLYIENSGSMYQDLLQPGATDRPALAFDVDPHATDWVFVFKPGSKFHEQVCEARIPLTR